MSTYTFMLLTSVAVSSFVVSQPGTHLQGGTPPVKIKGPVVITSDGRSTTLSEKKDSTYEYEVDLAQTAQVNTIVHISDLTNLAQPLDSTITIPAGSKVGYFTVQAVLPGTDVIFASCSAGSDLLGVTVL